VTLLDVSDPTDPVAVERLTVDGVTEGDGIRAERRALEANRELLRGSVAEDWIPWFVHETAAGDTVYASHETLEESGGLRFDRYARRHSRVPRPAHG
jgi:hypothetical protein